MGNLLDLFVFRYNRTDFHELNLDWIISDIKTLAETLKNFININTIKYADPIQWDITKQYEKNVVVVDPNSYTAYLSVNPVPVGVDLSRTDYWTPIFDLGQFITKVNENLTDRIETNTTTATFSIPVGGWVIWNGQLYEALTNITAGDAYVVDSNIKPITIEDFIPEFFNDQFLVEIVAGHNAVFNNVTANGDLNVTGNVSGNDATFTGELTAQDLIYNHTPIDIPTLHDGLVGYVPFKDDNGNTFRILTSNSADKLPVDPHINVKDYGAVGDGVTDDTAAIISAFTAAGINTAVYFPSGTYKVSSTLQVSAPYIFGDGEASHIKYYGNDKLFEVMHTGVTFKDLLLTADDDTSSIGIYALDKNYVVIESVYLNDFYDCIVFDGTCFYCTCTRLKGFHWKHAYIKTQDTAGTSQAGHQIAFENISFASGQGQYVFYLDNIGSFNFSDVLCSPQYITSATIHWGTIAPLAGLTWLVNTGLESAPKAMEFDATVEHYYFYFTNCYFGGHVSLIRCRQMTFTGCYFTGNEISCDMYLTQDITFVGCHFLNALNSCIQLLGGNYDTSLISCTNPSTGSYPFVTRSDNTIPVKVIGCGIKTPNYESTGSMDNFIMEANNVSPIFKAVHSEISASGVITIPINLSTVYPITKYGVIPLNTNAMNGKFNCTLSGQSLVLRSHDTYDTTSAVMFMVYAEL
ncbi:MAG: hypothetical protein J6Y78_08070 [Paludibacteraceae bacterium]|nr:hypothetical protein [Paludibacteraceae bacterium]